MTKASPFECLSASGNGIQARRSLLETPVCPDSGWRHRATATSSESWGSVVARGCYRRRSAGSADPAAGSVFARRGFQLRRNVEVSVDPRLMKQGPGETAALQQIRSLLQECVENYH